MASGTIDPFFIDGGTRSLMRDGGRYVDTGWYGIDDNGVPQIGPFADRQSCQQACDEIND